MGDRRVIDNPRDLSPLSHTLSTSNIKGDRCDRCFSKNYGRSPVPAMAIQGSPPSALAPTYNSCFSPIVFSRQSFGHLPQRGETRCRLTLAADNGRKDRNTLFEENSLSSFFFLGGTGSAHQNSFHIPPLVITADDLPFCHPPIIRDHAAADMTPAQQSCNGISCPISGCAVVHTGTADNANGVNTPPKDAALSSIICPFVTDLRF